MTINEEQEAIIKKEIYQNKNLPDDMKLDLIDHFCCSIENRMGKGYSFEESFTTAKNEISPNGLEEVHTETLYLLSPKKVSLMKKSVRISAIITLIIGPLGIIGKLLHLVGSNIFLLVGLGFLVFGFLPVFFSNRYKADIPKYLSPKLKNIAGFISISCIAIAIVMKLLHIPASNIFLFTGFFLFGFGYLPFFFFKRSNYYF